MFAVYERNREGSKREFLLVSLLFKRGNKGSFAAPSLLSKTWKSGCSSSTILIKSETEKEMDCGFCLLQYTAIMICRKPEKVLLKVREKQGEERELLLHYFSAEEGEFYVAFQREEAAVLGEKQGLYLLFLCSKEEEMLLVFPESYSTYKTENKEGKLRDFLH